MSHPFPGPNADDASDDRPLPWLAGTLWHAPLTSWPATGASRYDGPQALAGDLAQHHDAWHAALGTPIHCDWMTPMGGPSSAALRAASDAATRRLTLWHRAGPATVAAAHALVSRWPEAAPGWLECNEMERPLATLLHRLRTVYGAHQLHVRVPTVGGRSGTRALMDLVRECCNPAGAPTASVDRDGRPIRHGDMLIEDADSRALFVRGQHESALAVVAEDTADGVWMDRATVRGLTLGWTRTPPTAPRPLRHSVAVHHPAVPYALIICDGLPGQLMVLPEADA
jgi:hypothetical protein